MNKTFPTATAAARATHMRELPFAIAVAMSAPPHTRSSAAATAQHFREKRAAHRMPPL